MIEHGGRKQLLIWHAESLNSLDPVDGKLLWSVPLVPSHGMAIAAPGSSAAYLFASGFGEAAVLLKLDEQSPAASEVWRGQIKTAVYCANSPPFLEDGMIYGCDINSGALMGVRLDRWAAALADHGPNARQAPPRPLRDGVPRQAPGSLLSVQRNGRSDPGEAFASRLRRARAGFTCWNRRARLSEGRSSGAIRRLRSAVALPGTIRKSSASASHCPRMHDEGHDDGT